MAEKEYTRQIADALIEAGATVNFERFASNMGDENYRRQIADALIEAGATVNFESFNQKLLDEFNQGGQQKQEAINKSLNLAESLYKSSQNLSSIGNQPKVDDKTEKEKTQGTGEVTVPYVRKVWEERPFTKEMADNAWYNRMTQENQAMLGRLKKLEAETQPKKEEPKGTVKGKDFSKEIEKSFRDIQSKMYGEVVPKHIVENLDRYSPEDIAMLPKEMQMAVAGYYLQNKAEIERHNKQQEHQVGNSQGYYKPAYKQIDNADRAEEMVEIWRNGTIPEAKLNIDELASQYNSLKRGAKTIPTAEGLITEATFTTQDGVKYEGENAKMIEDAIKLNIEAQKIIDSPSSYDDSFGVANFFRGVGSQVEAKSMYLPFEKIARELRIGHIAKKMNSGQELTEPEDMLLRAYLTFCKANESRIYDMSLGYKAGQGTVDSLQFMLEMAIAGGITGAASKGAGNIITEAGKNWLRKSIKQGTSKAIGKGLFSTGRVLQGTTKAGVLMNGATATVGAYVDAALMPSTWLGISEGYKEDMLNGDGKYTFGEGFSRYTDAAIENITERVGGIIDPYMLKIGKTISKPMTKALNNTKLGRRLKSAKTSILNSKGYAFMSKVYDFSDSWLKPFSDLMQDPFSELGEEYIGGLINYGRSYVESDRSEELRQEFEHMITTEGFVETFAMTAPLSIFMGSANAVKVGNNIKNYSNAKKVFLNRLNTLGFTQEQARDILVYLDSFDNIENKKAANTYVGKMLYDVINQSDNYSTSEEKKKAIKDIQSVLSHYANASSAYSQDIKDLSENYKKLDEAKKKEVDEFLKNYTSEFIKNKQQQAIETAIEDSKTQTEEELAEVVEEEKALAETENLLPKNTPESSTNVINGQIEEGPGYVILGKTNSGELIKVARKGMTKKDKDTGLLVIGDNVGSIFIDNKRTPITKEQRLEFNRTIRNSNGWIGKNGKYVNIFAEREKELKEAEIKQRLLQQSNDASAQEGQEILMQAEAQEQALFDDLSNDAVAQQEKPAVHPYGKQFITDKNGVKQITDENGEPFKFENKLQANSIARNLNENYEGTYSFVVKSHNIDSVPYFTIEGTPAKQGEVATEEAKTKTKEVKPKEEKAKAISENNSEIVETPKGPQMIVYYKGEPYEVVSEVREDGSIVVPEDNLIRIKELEGDAIKSVRPSNVFANEKAEPIKTYPPTEKKASKYKPKDYQDTDVDIDDISDAIIGKYKDKSARWVELEYAEQQKRLSTAKGGDILDIENNLERLVEVALAIEDKTGVKANLDAVENKPAKPKVVEEPKKVEGSKEVEIAKTNTTKDVETPIQINTTENTPDANIQDTIENSEVENNISLTEYQGNEIIGNFADDFYKQYEYQQRTETQDDRGNSIENESRTILDEGQGSDSVLQGEQSDATIGTTSEGEQLSETDDISDNTDDDASNERPIEEVIQKINNGDFLDYEDFEVIHNTLKTDVIEFPERAFNTFMAQDRSIVGLYKLILTSLDKEIKESESFYASRNNTARLEELNAYKNQIQPLVSALESAVGNEAREQLENKVVVKIGLDESEYIDVEEGKINKSVDIDSLEIIDFFKSSKKKKLDDGQIDRFNYAVGKDAEGNLYLVKGEEAIKVTKDVLAELSGQEEWIPSTDWEKVTDADGNAYIVKSSGKGRVSSVPLGHSKSGLKGGYNYKKESGEQYAKSYEEIQKEENQIAANRYLNENGITDIDSLTEEQKQEIILGYADKYIWGSEVIENTLANDDIQLKDWKDAVKIYQGVVYELANILGLESGDYDLMIEIPKKTTKERFAAKIAGSYRHFETRLKGELAFSQLHKKLNGQDKKTKKQTPTEKKQEEKVESTYPEHISELIELVKGKKATDKITPLDYVKLRDKLKIFDIFSTAHYDRFERFFKGKNTWGGLRDWLNKYYDQFTNEYAMEYGADDEILVNNKPVLDALYETIPAKEDGSTRYELENEWMQDELNNLRDLLEYVLPANSRVTIVSPKEIERMVEDMTDVIVTAENVKVLEKWIRGVNINLLSKEEWARKFNNDSRGAFAISTGKAYIREGAPITTIMHEVGWHATFQWAKEYDQVLYNKMIGFVATAPNYLVSKIERKYAKLAKNNPEVIIDEIGAELFAKTYRKQLNRVLKDKKSMTWWSKLLDVFNQVFNKAKSFIFKKADFDLKNIEGMNAVSAMEYIADAMIRGEHLGRPYKKHKEETNKANKHGRPSNVNPSKRGKQGSSVFAKGQQYYRYEIENQLIEDENGKQTTEAIERINDVEWQTDSRRMVDDTARRMERNRDRSDIRMFEEGLGSQYNEHSEYSERNRRSTESERLVEISKNNGLYIPQSKTKELGEKYPKRTGESIVYVNAKDGKVYKIKDPYAKSAIKKGVQPEDAILEHIIHNRLFPETEYTFEGISEDIGDVRIVLSQRYIESVGYPTKKQIEEALAKKGLYPEGKYSFGNDLVSVTDIEGDNVLLGKDGVVYFIDPIISLKKPIREIISKYESNNEDDLQIEDHIRFELTESDEIYGVLHSELGNVLAVNKQMPLRDIIYYVTNYSDRADEFKQYLEISNPEEAIKNEAQILRHTILDWFSENISSYTDEEILNMTLADFLAKAKFPTSPEEVTEHLDRREEIIDKQDALLGSYENYGNQNAFSRWFDNYVTEMADDGLPIQRLLEGLNGWRKKKGLPPLTSEFDVVNQRNIVKSRAKGIIEVYENIGEYKALMNISAKLSKLLDKSSELADDRLFIDLQRLDDDTNRGQAILEYYLLAKDNIERGEKARGREAFGEAFKYDGEDMTFEQYVELIESILGEDNVTELWDKVRAATKFGLDYLHDHQVIGDSEYQEYLQRQYYVPERGFDDIYEEDERGHNSRGKNKKLNPKATIQARGGKTLATTPLASIKDIAYDSVVKALENDYRLSMYALINDEQNKEFFEEGFSFKGRTGRTNKQIEQPYATTYAVYMERETDEDGNFIVDEDGNFKWKLVNTKEEAKENEDKETMEKIQDSLDYISTLKKDLETTKKKIDRELRKKKKDQAEVDRLDTELKGIKEALKEEKRYISELRKQIHYSNRTINISDKAADVVYVRVNGKPVAMQFADQRIADAMNGIRADIKRLEPLIKANRWISNANTSYDPAFGPANFLRDIQQVAFVGGARYGAMFATRFSANIGAKVWSMTEITKYLYGGETSAKFEEFIKSGAMTGYIYSANIDEYRKDVEQTIKEINKIVNSGKWKDDVLATLRLPSELSEIYVRYVAYQTAREMGYNEFNSAVIAKNAGVNFDKAGYGSNDGLRGVLYWTMQHQSFGKATLRGIMSMVEVMAVNKDSKAKARLFGSMMTFIALSVLGAFIKDMLSSDDDEQDEWRRLKNENILTSTSDYDKRRSFVSWRDRQWNEILDSIFPKTLPISQNLIPTWGLGQNIYKLIKNSIVRENIGKSDYRKLLYQHSDEDFFNHVINGRKEDGTPLYTEEEIKEIAKDYFTKPNTQIISDLLFDFSSDVISNWLPATSSVSEVGMNAIEYAKERKDGDVYIKKSAISIAPTLLKSPMEALMNVDYFGNNIYYNNKYSGRKSNFSDFYAVKDIFENKEGLKAETKYGENGIESVDGFDEPAISQLLHITKQFTPRYVDALAEYTDRKLGEKFYGYLTEEEKNAGAPEYGILSKEDLLREYKNVEKEIMADKDLSDFDKENAINNIRTNIDYLERPEYYRRQDRVIAKQISEIASAAKDRMKDLKEQYAKAELSNDSDRIAELQSEIDQVNHILYSEESAKKLYEAIQKTNIDNLRMKLYPTEDYRKISDQELAERGLTADKYYEIINARKRAMLISKDIVLSGRRLNLVKYEGD